MADIPPINPGAPSGADSPMKKSTGKVQPKKETVRINLPPKPTAAPTIKLPTLPPGGPTGAGGMPSPAPTTLRSAPVAPVVQPQRGAAPAVATRPAPVVVQGVTGFDQILAIAACVTALAAVGTTVWMLLILNNAITQ
ncbi:MAG TPA: hypothetical protein VHX90_01305 [Verrucomicrobiae bacterium]|jgi:hypothetical protein|nr:hypothetical protein [Verrucomicrobiae bacterium]